MSDSAKGYENMLKKLDLYIIRKFLSTFVFSITLILAIFIVFDIKDKLSSFSTNNIPLREIIFDYYLMFIPYYGNLFSPLFVFISVIFFYLKNGAAKRVYCDTQQRHQF